MVCISTYCIHTYANPTKLIIENITSKKGTLYISYIQNENQYKKVLSNKESIRSLTKHNIIGQFKTVGLSDHQSIQIPATINASAYAIIVFQDLNKNEKLDKGWFGIPKEPYGFSNNPSTKKGAPSFGEVILSQPKEGDIKIVLNGSIR